MTQTVLKIHLMTLLCLASPHVKADQFPASYQATYEVIRGGKAMAELSTTFTTSADESYTLKDVTTGTKGLASLTGFKRTETSHFQFNLNFEPEVEHTMQQKVAFKKKFYQFKTAANQQTITGHSKQNFTIESEQKPISSHMLPLWLASHACSDQLGANKRITVPVLKSKRIKTYEFRVIDESQQFFRAERIYPTDSVRSSQIWLDKNKECLPVRTIHQEADEPTIETRLLKHQNI